MAVPTTSVTIIRGDTPTFTFTIKDSAGAALDLTTATAIRFAAKSTLALADANAIFNVACTVTPPATDGICTATLAQTDSTPAGTYTAELQVNLASGTTITSFQFELIIKEDVLKAIT